MRSSQRCSGRHPCPYCGGVDRCLLSTSDGRYAMCENPPVEYKKESAKRYNAVFCRDFWLIPLSAPVIINQETVDETECSVRWYGYTKVLNLLLASLNLSEEHFQNLLSRGLQESAIISNGYKSMPTIREQRTVIDYLWSLYAEFWDTIPGFVFTEAKKPAFIAPPGALLIPIRDITKKIVGIQFRTEKLGKKKYRWFSHNNLMSDTPIHVAGKSSNLVIITEGPLKADITGYYASARVLSFQGVHAISSVIPLLTKLQPKKVLIALDMDLYLNESVYNAVLSIINQTKAWFPQILLWDRNFKGIDDFIVLSDGDFVICNSDTFSRFPVEIKTSWPLTRQELLNGLSV